MEISNFITIACRRLARNKTYTFLNAAGLAVGIGACVLIFLVVRYELSYDNFHPNRYRIFRLVSVPFREGAVLGSGPGVPLPVAQALRADYPAVEKAAAIFGRNGQVTIPGERGQAKKMFDEEGGVFYAEPEFFDIFAFSWLTGNPKDLAAPNTVVLTRETASRYFGDWRIAVGKTLQFNNADLFKVAGVLKDVPGNTDFPLKVVFSYSSLTNVDLKDWQGTYGRGYTFVRLATGVSVARFDADMRQFVDRHTPPGLERRGVIAQPLGEMHQDSRFGNFNNRTFGPDLIRSLILTAAFLLVIACVNFVNLSTAQAVKRSRETGIRKVLGSSRRQLVWQFMGEAGLMSVLAVAVALSLAAAALPFLNDLLGIHIRLRLTDSGLLGFLGLTAAATTLLAGLYPAMVLSGFNPVNTLKNSLTARTVGGISLRRGLVVLQFCIAQVLIICVLVVSRQMNFFRHTSLGFNPNAIVNVPIPGDSVSQQKMEVVRQDLLQLPGVDHVSFSTFSPLDNDIWSNQFKFDHSSNKTNFQAYFKWADADFFQTYRPVLVAGRTYQPSDTLREYVVNETLVRSLGIRDPKEILGKEINIWDQLRGPVVGVVRDFNTNSLQKPITPVVMGCWKAAYGLAGIKLRSGDAAPTLAAIERIWKGAYPDYVYSYQFLEEKIANYYKEEGQLSGLYRVFAGIAIFISCLGLYGLMSFMAVQRTKEIGVRKVLGASVANMMLLLSKEFTVLAGVSFAVAAPVGYILTHRWLEGFAYRIRPGAGLFLLAALCSVIIAWVTVGYRTYRAATANPTRALRAE